MKTTQLLTLGVLASGVLSTTAIAGETPLDDSKNASVAMAPAEIPTYQEPDFFRLDPTFHIRIALGDTSMPWTGMELGGHDPRNDGFNLQGVEVGTNLHIGEHLSGFATANIFKPRHEDVDWELEEAFIKIHDLPFGFELRGGRMLARFGTSNAVHLHAWDFIDNKMANVRFLGEDGFAIEGGELTWLLPTAIDDVISLGFGSPVTPDHDHGEEAGGGDHHDHAHEAELARPTSNVFVARYQAKFGPDDFNQFQLGASYLTGKNGWDRTTDIYGVDFSYTWRENGLESGGRQFRWITEFVMRDVSNDEGGFTDTGVNTAVLWEFIETWEVGVRYGYLEEVSDPELSGRERISPVLTKHFSFGNDRFALIRLQYNHDEIKNRGGEDSIWLQLGFDWGPAEVR